MLYDVDVVEVMMCRLYWALLIISSGDGRKK
jgi:hypothetical protein